jgi:lipopolysaccharide/colanic/teichoic acid biosynthesis glycosyltransferase
MQTRIFFSSNGEPIAFLQDEDVFTLDGTWVGFTPDKAHLYDSKGSFVGMFLDDGRIAVGPESTKKPAVSPPSAAIAEGIPFAIPRRPRMPALPPPYREAVLDARDQSMRPLTFVAAQTAVLSVTVAAIAFAAWQLTENNGLFRLNWSLPSALIGVLFLVVLATFFAGLLIAFNSSSNRSRKLLVVGTSSARGAIISALTAADLPRSSVVELESSYVPSAANEPMLEPLLRSKSYDYVLLANVLDSSDGTFLAKYSALMGSLEKHSKLVDLPSLLERERRQLMPSWHSTQEFFGQLAERSTEFGSVGIRIADLWIATFLLWLVFPVMMITAFFVFVESPGPVVYRDERVGYRGKRIFVFRFRSMRIDAEKDASPRWATSGDTRVTRVGRVIRRLRVDELPQLFNVLRGDMSMVGPRPERPSFAIALSEQIPEYGWRHLARPGITGWAQVRYQYGSAVEDSYQKLGYDLYYIKHRSLRMYWLVILETLGLVLTGHRAR